MTSPTIVSTPVRTRGSQPIAPGISAPSIRPPELEAARSPLKILNHLDLSRDHDEVSRVLGFNRDATSRSRFSANGKVLSDHQARRVDTEETLGHIARNARLDGVELSKAAVRALALRITRAAHVEFHPTDVCQLACKGCTYGHDVPALKPPDVAFPFDGLDRLANLAPRAITVVGGGDPLLYRDCVTRQGFPALVARLRQLLPETQLGLITNGATYPEGDWSRAFRWVRVSVDAATAATFSAFRGRDVFDRVYMNVVRLLHETTGPVGVGFVFCHDNIAEAAVCARFFYDLVRRECPEALERFSIQYRPLRRDPKDFGRDDFPEGISEDEARAVEREFESLAREDDGFARFVREQTNAPAIRTGNTHQPVPFARCDYSMIHRLIRANGDVRPCCMRLAEPEFDLGNILRDPPETIALNVLFNAAYLRPGCDGPGCKLGGLNRLIAQGLGGEVQPSTNPEVAGNPFFG